MYVLMGMMETLTSVVYLVLVICFVVLVVQVYKIREYLYKMYQYDKIRMFEEGLMNPETKKFSKWKFDKKSGSVRRVQNM